MSRDEEKLVDAIADAYNPESITNVGEIAMSVMKWHTSQIEEILERVKNYKLRSDIQTLDEVIDEELAKLGKK